MHVETLREPPPPEECGASGTKKLPFAGYSVAANSKRTRQLFDKDCLGRPRLRSLRELRRGRLPRRPARRSARLARRRRDPRQTSLPVVIGAGSHPFPFRTRKLSLLPPMVVYGKLYGRVGRCRHYFRERARWNPSSPFLLSRPAATAAEAVSQSDHRREPPGERRSGEQWTTPLDGKRVWESRSLPALFSRRGRDGIHLALFAVQAGSDGGPDSFPV